MPPVRSGTVTPTLVDEVLALDVEQAGGGGLVGHGEVVLEAVKSDSKRGALLADRFAGDGGVEELDLEIEVVRQGELAAFFDGEPGLSARARRRRVMTCGVVRWLAERLQVDGLGTSERVVRRLCGRGRRARRSSRSDSFRRPGSRRYRSGRSRSTGDEKTPMRLIGPERR